MEWFVNVHLFESWFFFLMVGLILATNPQTVTATCTNIFDMILLVLPFDIASTHAIHPSAQHLISRWVWLLCVCVYFYVFFSTIKMDRWSQITLKWYTFSFDVESSRMSCSRTDFFSCRINTPTSMTIEKKKKITSNIALSAIECMVTTIRTKVSTIFFCWLLVQHIVSINFELYVKIDIKIWLSK